MYKPLLPFNKKQKKKKGNKLLEKYDKIMKRLFTKQKTQISNKQMKKIFNLINNQENMKENHSGIILHAHQMGKNK